MLNRILGERGERAAARFLRRSGLRILTRHYCTPYGEIDLIAREGPVVVFVEVRSRRQGAPAETITAVKERRLTLAALHFLKRYRLLEESSRFDVVAVVWPSGSTTPTFEHIRNAFEASGKGQMFR
jgi:putative endonuclease